MGRPPSAAAYWLCVLCFCSFIFLDYEYLWMFLKYFPATKDFSEMRPGIECMLPVYRDHLGKKSS